RGSADRMPGWREQRQCVETLFGVRNVDQADFERRIWIVSSEAVGDHCSDIVSGDVDLLVPERLGPLVNILGHVLLVVAQPRFGRTSHSAKINRDHAVALRRSGMILWNCHQVWGQPGSRSTGVPLPPST